MSVNFRKILRVKLTAAPVDWELICENCHTIHKGFYEINRNFSTSFDPYALIKHAIYCDNCIPKMRPLIQQGNQLGREISDDKKIHICSECWRVSIGIEEIENNVYLDRTSKRGYQSKCISCSKEALAAI